MNEKFKIIDTSPSYGVRYPYTPMPSNGKDARVEIYPPSRLAEGIAFAKEHDIRAVSIVGNGGMPFSLDFSAFEGFPEIEVLQIRKKFKIAEVKGAEALYDTAMRSLALDENAEFELDFSRFKNLEALETTQNKKMKFNRLPPALRCAKISKLSHENLGIFRDTPRLERLELNFSKVTSLEGIKGCDKLDFLFIFSAPRLTNISEINALKKLKWLYIERCRLLTSAAMQGVQLGALERLDARFNVENLKFLANFPNLREFYFKYVADGDLAPILESKIRGCGFESRGHYSHTWSELSALLRAKFKDT
ncbi:leucine-rich repeat domain-containing protein [Campylobacter rectus]|uniref:leucine-rich repeat domain-containing protein n=1 Tax=Campylobacter rectus TaxID=203 RepID=UPI0023F1247A|nr:hypothetical protein [Campylobacter rectus]